MRRNLCIALVAALFITGAFAQKPNFSGTWKLNVDKSEFGPLPGYISRTDMIEHSDPKLKVTINSETQQGKQEATSNYTTDGKEATNKMGSQDVKSTVTWQGNNLVMNAKTSFPDGDITINSVWSLAEDGKTLTQTVHLTAPTGEADRKLVFEKQN